MSTTSLRLATESDLQVINEIYNYYVLRSTCTYQIDPESMEDRLAWFRDHPPDKYPVLVATNEEEIVGWGSLSRWRPRAAMAPTVEVTVYIRHDMHRQGIGKLILDDLIERARRLGFHSVIGSVSADQMASIALQESLGFQRVAHLSQVAFKFGNWLDLLYLQLKLNAEVS